MRNLPNSNMVNKHFSSSFKKNIENKFSKLVEKKENTICSLKEVEKFLTDSKKIIKYIRLYKFFK